MTKYMTPMFTLMTITMTTRLNSSDTSSGGVSVNQLEVTPGVSLMWGIADTTAVVGRLFSYHIPSDAFSGPVAGYKVGLGCLTWTAVCFCFIGVGQEGHWCVANN